MNEDRLTHLLTEATDLKPSEALQARVSPLPQSRCHGERRNFPRASWFALSGLSAGIAVVAFLAAPREVSAQDLLDQAGSESQGSSFHFRAWEFNGASWHEARYGLSAPGWARYETAKGELSLITPTGCFARSRRDAPVLRRPALDSSPVDDLRLDRHLKILRTLGYPLTIRRGQSITESGRSVQDITIECNGRDERETITLDKRTELPIRMLIEMRSRSNWVPRTRIEYGYASFTKEHLEFWRGIDRKEIVSRTSLAQTWERRFRTVLRTLRLSDGSRLQVRDLRALPNGDVLMVYSGPQIINVHLASEDGMPFARVGSPLNDSRRLESEMPDLTLDGAPLRFLWFTPIREGASRRTHVLFDVVGGAPTPFEHESLPTESSQEGTTPAQPNAPDPLKKENYQATGTFLLSPVREQAPLPAWTDAVPYGSWLIDGERWRDDARIIAAYDGWIDASGHHIDGRYRLQPTGGEWSGEPPRQGLRRDPKAAAAALRAMETMRQHEQAREETGNPSSIIDRWRARFEREMRER